MHEGTQIIKTKKRLLKAASLGVLMAIAALLITNPVKAFRPTAVEFHFGMVGITRGQSARLNVLNASREPIQLSLNFSNSDGRLIRQAVETLEPGRAVFLDLTPSTVDEGAGRLQIHASIQFGDLDSGGVGRQIIPTLEVFDNDTGRTQVVLGACDGSV